mgnify:CR=1 FL=1
MGSCSASSLAFLGRLAFSNGNVAASTTMVATRTRKEVDNMQSSAVGEVSLKITHAVTQLLGSPGVRVRAGRGAATCDGPKAEENIGV